MKSLLLLLLLVFTMSASLPSKKTVLKSTIKQHWRTKIGCTSYRTIPVVVDGKIFIGSNGDYFRDYALDEGNGVFLLNAQTGKLSKNFETNHFGDMDVNGILFFNGNIYYGNDNEEFFCVDQNGKIKWRIAASGDIEHRPVFIQSSGKQLIVFATETGQIEAIDAITGKHVWSYFDKDFSGWKLGQNRTLFKIKMHFSEDCIFFNEPSLADLNADGVNDLVYNSKWGNFTAINGKTGKLMWEIDNNDHPNQYTCMGREKPIIIGEGEKSQIMVLLSAEIGTKEEIAFYNAKGKLINKVEALSSLGSTMISQTSDVFITSTTIIHPSENPKDVKIIPIENSIYKNKNGEMMQRYYQGQVSANKINFNNEPCALVLYQYDPENSADQSPMLLIGLKTGKIHYKVNLPSTSEFPPFISDINNDGKLDVLVGCYDGNLYCFDLEINKNQLITN